MAGYQFPLDPGTFTVGRTDMGVDYGLDQGAPVRAIGNAIVDFVGRYRGFGPYVAYHLTEGPQAGTEIYDAENQTILVHRGQHLRVGQVVGRVSGGSGGIEMGYAMRSGSYLPLAQPHYNEGDITEEGLRFAAFMNQLRGGDQVGGMSPSERVEFIAAGAYHRGLDPGAVLADAHGEGGFVPGAPGDSGLSFGPFQLKKGGRLPPNIEDPQSWAWSPAGMNYALDGIKRYAYGLRGEEAINQIVRKFEIPADPASEVARDVDFYHSAAAAGAKPPIPNVDDISITKILPTTWKPWKRGFWWGSTDPGGVPGDIIGATGLGDVAHFFKVIVWPFTHPLRAGEIFAGSVLVLVGVVLVAKSLGVNVNIPVPAVEAAAAAATAA